MQHKVDFIKKLAVASSVAGLRRSYESLPKAKLAPKEKVMVTDGGLLPVWSTIAFWFRAKPLPLRSMLNKLMRCMENCNKCSQHWSTEWPQFSMTMPDHMSHASHTTKPSKVEWTGLQVLLLSLCSADLSQTDYHFFKHLDNFLQGKSFHNQQEAENAFQEFVKSWSTDFYSTRINKLISHWQKCVDFNGSYFY